MASEIRQKELAYETDSQPQRADLKQVFSARLSRWRPEAPLLLSMPCLHLPPLCPLPLPSIIVIHLHAQSLRRPMHIAGWPEYAACQPALCLSTRPHTVKAVPGWTPGLRTLQNALFLGGCSLGTKHHCGQAAGGRGVPPEESKRAKALLLVVPPQVNQSASLHQMGSY